ncbi:50S ribosomal protein L6 [Candidatus Wolfebacteria bacterium RIFCSPLOWO2_01_FULL_38_11]|uniref:Large ribosomal subunit protein uL6 n=2 Tax=Candidatus Wolfeibacteriota TaxID=1752735 RepID=A0A0G0J527_9BACT|nr:MAG: 50S ribosomal protein L6 [Candidatus Wolfebacteria bacterium GW2011_GWC1_37_10]OGM91366.1 MAG: 50S ribosomal protein L6 [Candidatus Wolfebacteria bacterium RIFCSPLOWO2_01_FULL_38_11]
MSKIGKQPIIVPEAVSVKEENGSLEFKGKNGTLKLKVLPHIKFNLDGGNLLFSAEDDSKQARANWGTMRALAKNAVTGLTEGFFKILEIEGVGYRASMEGKNLVLNVGFSHPVKIVPPEEILISVEKNAIKISGIDKSLVGKIADKIRATKKPEPYKGKGIRYQGEYIRRKEGKKAAGATK